MTGTIWTKRKKKKRERERKRDTHHKLFLIKFLSTVSLGRDPLAFTDRRVNFFLQFIKQNIDLEY